MPDSPAIYGDLIPTLCSIGPRALLMTGFFREWLAMHFSRAENIESPDLRSKLWKAIDSTKILIESITRFNPKNTEERPAVIIKRNDWTVEHRGIGDRMQGGIDFQGAVHYETFVSGSHTLFCLSPAGGEAEILGAEVYREFNQFSAAIRENMGLMRFQVAGVGGLGLLEEAHQTFVVPVTVGYVFEEKWRVIEHAPVLQTIQLSVFVP